MDFVPKLLPVITALRMNRAELVIFRKLWTEVGWHPPD